MRGLLSQMPFLQRVCAKDLQRKGKKKNEKLSKQMGPRCDSGAVAPLQYRYGVLLVHLQPGDR